MRKIEDRIIEAIREEKPARLSKRDDVRKEQGTMVYKLWYTDIASLASGGQYTELITLGDYWYSSRTTQSRLRALRFAFAR